MNHLYNFKLYNESISRENIEIKIGLDKEEFMAVCRLCSEELSDEIRVIGPDTIYRDLLQNDPQYSVGAYDKTNGNLIGGLLCKPKNLKAIFFRYPVNLIEFYQDINLYDGKKGIEGSALSVKSEFRNGQVVFKLLKTLENLDFDYISIGQFESLRSNINYLNKGCTKFCKLTIQRDMPVVFYIRDLK